MEWRNVPEEVSTILEGLDSRGSDVDIKGGDSVVVGSRGGNEVDSSGRTVLDDTGGGGTVDVVTSAIELLLKTTVVPISEDVEGAVTEPKLEVRMEIENGADIKSDPAVEGMLIGSGNEDDDEANWVDGDSVVEPDENPNIELEPDSAVGDDETESVD